MFDFNEDNILNDNSTIDSIQLNLLDIRFVFFNCYKIFIKVEKYNDGEYLITNIVEENKINISHNELITYKSFESLLRTEFTCINISSIDKCIEEVYTSKYFKILTKRGFGNITPSKVLIKFNDNIDVQDLIKLSDINDYNNVLDDINRQGCLDITTYNRFFDLLPNPLYKIGDNVLDPKFNKYCRKILSNLHEDYNDSSIFYMDKTNSKFYFILSLYILRRMSAYSFAELINCSSAYHLIENNLGKHETNSEKFLIYKRKGYPFYLDTKYDKRKINVTITDNVHNTTIPDYILRKYVNYDDIRNAKICTNSYRIIMVEPC